MKTKILTWSKTGQDKIVFRYEELEKIAEGVYAYLREKGGDGEGSDTLGIVLKIEHVFFDITTCSRERLKGEDFSGIETKYISKYRQIVEGQMQNDEYISIRAVRVFEELGWDSRPLVEYRERWQARKKEKRIQEERDKALAAQIAAEEATERERLRLDGAKADFIAGKSIGAGDFISLCKLAGVPVPLRTHGTVNKSVERVFIDGRIYFFKQQGKRKPDLTGCWKLIQAYAGTVNNEQ